MADGSVNIDVKLEDSKAKAEASKAGKDIGKNLENGMKGASSAAKNTESDIKSAMEGAASSSESSFAKVGDSAENGFGAVGNAASDAATSVEDSFSDIQDTSSDAFSKVGDDAEEMGESIEGAGETGSNAFLDLAKNALKALAAIELVKQAADFLKSSLDAYANFEQLEGGVQTLFGAGGAESVEEYAKSVGKSVDEVKGKYEELKSAESKVFEDAKNAYREAGVSANTYMEQATSFSASLVSSLGGDTVKAANYANTAIVDMSDNANKMGTDIERIQDAYQGFAKQNYTMLDNLKLGYGGTKTEMERLIEDANKLKEANGEAADLTIDSYADVIEAIHLVQEEMGITGTTQKEATETIEGSLNMAKAAYENFLVGLADENADIQELADQLFESIGIAAQNIIPRLTIIVQSLSRTLTSILPEAATAMAEQAGDLVIGLAAAIVSALPAVAQAAIEIIGTLAITLASAIPDLVVQIAETLPESIPMLIEAALNIVTAIVEALPEIVQALVDAIPLIVELLAETLVNSTDALIMGFVQLFLALVAALPEIIASLIAATPMIIESLVNALIICTPSLVEGFIQLFMAFIEALPVIIGNILGALPQVISSILGMIGSWFGRLFSKAAEFFGQFLSGISSRFGEIIGKVGELPGAILGALGDMGSLLLGAGRAVLEGFLNGLKSAWDGVTGFIGGIGDWIVSHKGPKEYDLKMLVPAGNWIMEGLQTGLEQAIPDLERTLNDITGKVETGFDIKVNADSWDTAVDTGEGIARGIVLGYEKVNPAGQMIASMGALMAMMAGNTTTNNNTSNWYVSNPKATPDEMFRAARREQRYGLAGQYA